MKTPTPYALIAGVAALFLPACPVLAQTLPEPGFMLRGAQFDAGTDRYAVPEPFASLPPAQWPVDGWYRLTILPDRVEIETVVAPPGRMPEFLRSIAAQVGRPAGDASALATEESQPDHLYVRVPGVRLRVGAASAYRFKNGTSTLRPKLDYRYELSLGGAPFSFQVRNGARTKDGIAYGDGARYTIEYGSDRYEYKLGEFGWDSSITAIADLDGDGKPDFLITVGGNNSGYEYLLLSSKARPGTNPATASIYSMGC